MKLLNTSRLIHPKLLQCELKVI